MTRTTALAFVLVLTTLGIALFVSPERRAEANPVRPPTESEVAAAEPMELREHASAPVVERLAPDADQPEPVDDAPDEPVGGGFTGQVLGPGGETVEDAFVVMWKEINLESFTAVTGPEGRFRLDSPPPAPVDELELIIFHPGWSTFRGRLHRDQPVTLALGPHGSLDAQLVDARTLNTILVERATATFRHAPGALPSVLSLPTPSGDFELHHGHLRVDGIDALLTDVLISVDGYHPASVPLTGGHNAVTLELQSQDDVFVMVADAVTGAPIPRATVEVVTIYEDGPGTTRHEYRGFKRERHDPGGRFAIDGADIGPDRRVLYTVRAPGYQPTEQLELKQAGDVLTSDSVLVQLTPES